MNGSIIITAEMLGNPEDKEQAMKVGVQTKIEHVNVIDKIILVKALMDSLEFSSVDQALLMTAMMSNNWPLDHMPNISLRGTPGEINRQMEGMKHEG